MYMYTYEYLCMYVCMYLCMYVYTYTYIYIYIHTYRHIYTYMTRCDVQRLRGQCLGLCVSVQRLRFPGAAQRLETHWAASSWL